METWGITLGIYYIWSGKTLEENIGGETMGESIGHLKGKHWENFGGETS